MGHGVDFAPRGKIGRQLTRLLLSIYNRVSKLFR